MISKKEDSNVSDAKQKTYKKYTIDFNGPVENNLLTLESALKYLQSNMKLNGIKGKLGDSILINSTEKTDKAKNTIVISVDNKLEFSKKYLKYLVKKYLKREGIGNFLNVSSTTPNAYTVKIIKKNES